MCKKVTVPSQKGVPDPTPLTPQPPRSEDDASTRSNIEKKMRELENKVSDLSEDLEAERAAHKRTDKLKRDLNEVSCEWKSGF